MKRRIQGGCAVLLTLTMILAILIVPQVNAAFAVDTEKSGSIEIQLKGDFAEDLSFVEIPVKLYKVASITETGVYVPEGDFTGLDLTILEKPDMTADEWLKCAKNAQEMIKESTAFTAISVTGGESGVITGLDTGMYLVNVQGNEGENQDKIHTANYAYTFLPYLISLPNNYYYTTGNDEWVYNLVGEHAIGLKPEQKERYGNLVIDKELLNQNISGAAEKSTFVFQINIVTLDGKQESKVVALTFDQIGGKQVLIEKIAAGSLVTVTEIYSGASYKVEGDATSGEFMILADQDNTVSFTNVHNDSFNGGYGVINNFYLENDQYQHRQLQDNAVVD